MVLAVILTAFAVVVNGGQIVDSELDRWRSIANDCAQSGRTLTDQLVYYEPSMLRDPVRSVVLGDAQHQLRQLPVAFENAPTSLRDVEETTQFKG